MTINEKLHYLPWGGGEMTLADYQQWVAGRKEAGRKIDIETCELGCWAAYDADPYNARPDLPEQMRQIGTNRFVRSPESNGWVHEGDLPEAAIKALYDRIEREFEAYERRRL